jgi:hypothetical protein
MPLIKGKSKVVVAANIKRMLKEGRPKAQSVAIAMRMAGKPRPKAK